MADARKMTHLKPGMNIQHEVVEMGSPKLQAQREEVNDGNLHYGTKQDRRPSKRHSLKLDTER